ncbi:MAG: lipid-A-disaccharide synthase [Verrucomicrobia bacterium]|nr:lipid-A-disaccharide synthase [Verrucomicrobiota bacterium]
MEHSDDRRRGSGAQFFGAGGPKTAAAGVELALDLTQHSVIGLIEVLKNYAKFKRLFNRLLELAFERQPDAIICVDFSGFNRRFARAVRQRIRREGSNWQPKIIQYVSPQVWASRPGRAKSMARHFDLLLTIFPFEKSWYAEREPELRVEFVGHPICDRFQVPNLKLQTPNPSPLVLLLPGSRVGELKRHLPVMFAALEKLQINQPEIRARMVLPNADLAALAQSFLPPDELEIQIGELDVALREATIAIASTGTVTMECAYFGVPTIALYKTSWSTYQIGKRIIRVQFLAMPNLLANEEIFPEFIQNNATAENISRAALELLNNAERRGRIIEKLREVVASLGGTGASQRAAEVIWKMVLTPAN